ncbi:MAG: hypothetical protein M1600_05405 [Firmicutes bacterium]|jgi:hypothetical protein|nr:hypothetical protein [Bacillota bacterium]
MTRWSQEAIVNVIKAVYQEEGYCTSYKWMRDRRSPHFYTIIHFFGSWHAAWEAAGFDVPLRLAPKDRVVTRELIVEALQEVGHFESERVWSTNHRIPSAPSIRKIFGTWQEAWEAAGLWSEPVSPKEKILERLSEVGSYCSETYWDQMGFRPVAQTIRNHFGTWGNAWRAAGITPTPAKVRWSKEQIIDKLREHETYCTARDWDSLRLNPTSRTIRKVFGSWKGAWTEAGIASPISRATVTEETVISAFRDFGEYVSAQYWDASDQKPSSHTIRKLFGSWAAAWAAAGIEGSRIGSVVNPNEAPTQALNELDAKLWEKRQQGVTLQHLSQEFGMSTSTIARRILRARIPHADQRSRG